MWTGCRCGRGKGMGDVGCEMWDGDVDVRTRKDAERQEFYHNDIVGPDVAGSAKTNKKAGSDD